MQTGLNILLVDDEPAVRLTIKLILEHRGHEVGAVDGGEAALALLARQRFDVVITDYSMPGMRGDQLVARIRQQLPTQPIIMATAFAEDLAAQPNQTQAVDALLQKPFSLTDLDEAIERVTAQSAPQISVSATV
jgi:CheY-like chemotaxis protein